MDQVQVDRKFMAMLACNGPLTPEQLGWLTPEQLGWLTPEQLGGLTPRQLGGLTPEQLGWLTPRQLGGLTPEQLGWLTPEQLGWLTPRQLGGLTPEQLGWLTPRQLGGLTPEQLGWLTPEQLGGLTPRQLGGLTPESRDFALGLIGKLDVPKIEKPYSRMLADIKAGQRIHKQSDWGPDCDPETNLCKTPMCTAGHLVNMAGKRGYELRDMFGWEGAANLIHRASRPDVPPQNFGGIPQEWALAYIEERAAEEEAKG